jgi:enoyl-CoA hydratase
VILDGAGDRAFCAGGDIAQVYRTGPAGDFGGPRLLARRIPDERTSSRATTKPIVAFLHGFVMGGGVGLGGHGSHRVVGESTQVAMPECGIGLIPDVGGTYGCWAARRASWAPIWG